MFAGSRALFVASGARSLILVSRRRGLYQASIPSKIACDSWTFVSHRWVSRTSRYIVDQNDSIIALSTEATRPIEPGSLAWRGRCPNARTCIALVAMTDRARRRSPSSTRHLQGIDDQVGARVVGDRPAHNHPRIPIQHRAAVHRGCAGAVFGDVGDPQRVRTVGDEPTLHQVIVDSRLRFLNTRGAP